jgi:hypothetical protein
MIQATPFIDDLLPAKSPEAKKHHETQDTKKTSDTLAIHTQQKVSDLHDGFMSKTGYIP